MIQIIVVENLTMQNFNFHFNIFFVSKLNLFFIQENIPWTVNLIQTSNCSTTVQRETL